MGKTITEKIMAKSANKSRVLPGDNVWLNVDLLMSHDVCGPPMIDIWKREFGNKATIWDKDKVVLFPDHYIFTANEHAQRNVQILREFSRENHLPHYYDVGTDQYKGVCHVALAEEGFNLPGTVLFGTDSHSCTSGAFGLFSTGVGNTDAAFILGTGKMWEKVPQSVKFIFEGELPLFLMAKDLILHIIGELTTDGATYCALEFAGEAISAMDIYERMTLTNMAIEVGAMNGIIAADDKTQSFVSERTSKKFEIFVSDDDAHYNKKFVYPVEKFEPVIAKPHSPDKVEKVRKVQSTKLTQCYIGSCTGGKISDFRAAAHILIDQAVKIPTYVVPATTNVARQLKEEIYQGKKLWEIFEQAGCKIASPSCAACLGGPADTVGRAPDNAVVISTTNRNFPGRMGSKKSSVYLASPLTVAASAITGRITDPRDFLI